MCLFVNNLTHRKGTFIVEANIYANHPYAFSFLTPTTKEKSLMM